MPVSPYRRDQKLRRRLVARMVIRGDSQAKIAVRLGVTQSTVSRDLREIRKDRCGRAALEMWVDDRFAEERLDFLTRELWDAWDESHKPLIVVRPFGPRRRRGTKLTITEQPAGDPRCLRWLLESFRVRQIILRRKQGVRYTDFSRIEINLERIRAALESLRRLYPADAPQPAAVVFEEDPSPADVGQVSQPAGSVPGRSSMEGSDAAGWKTCPTTTPPRSPRALDPVRDPKNHAATSPVFLGQKPVAACVAAKSGAWNSARFQSRCLRRAGRWIMLHAARPRAPPEAKGGKQRAESGKDVPKQEVDDQGLRIIL